MKLGLLPGSHVFLVVVWLDVEVKLLTNNALVHLQNLLTCTLEVTGCVIGRRDPQSHLLDLGADWLEYCRHGHEHVHDVS